MVLYFKSGGTEPKHIDRMFYALETFCENLEDALVPHLPLLMERYVYCYKKISQIVPITFTIIPTPLILVSLKL